MASHGGESCPVPVVVDCGYGDKKSDASFDKRVQPHNHSNNETEWFFVHRNSSEWFGVVYSLGKLGKTATAPFSLSTVAAF
jgi:hypothetical protein